MGPGTPELESFTEDSIIRESVGSLNFRVDSIQSLHQEYPRN